MHPVFQILPKEIIPSETNFFAGISGDSLSFFYQKSEDKTITGLSFFKAEKNIEHDILAGLLRKTLDNEKLLGEKFNKVAVWYAFDENILTPQLYYDKDQNDENLNLIFGDLHRGIVLADHVAEKDIYNVFRIPYAIHQVISGRFAEAVFSHQYSYLVKRLEDAENLFKVIFFQTEIVIILQKDNKLQIIKAFKYMTAEDVLYHMLNVCHQFNAGELDVQLSGMIEKDSALYREIEKYFVNISFAGLPAGLLYADEIKAFPSHFFCDLFAFALCV